MDNIMELEMVATRMRSRARGEADAADLKTAQRLITIVRRELETARQERHQATAEVIKLQARIKVLEQEIKLLKKGESTDSSKEDQHVEHLGALFVRKPGGRVLETPRCRECRKPLKAVSRDVPYSCPSCQVFALFRPSELNDVLLTLRR
jgi:hypothetical protein